TAPAVERGPRRYVARRPAPPTGGGSRTVWSGCAAAAAGETGSDRPVASQRAFGSGLGPDRATGPEICGQLVGTDGPDHSVPHLRCCARGQRCLLAGAPADRKATQPPGDGTADGPVGVT